MKCEAYHYGLSVAEKQEQDTLREQCRDAGIRISVTNNDDTQKAFDDAIEKCVQFEIQHNIKTTKSNKLKIQEETNMEEYIKRIEQIAARCTESQSDGYSQIMRICDAMREEQRCCLRYASRDKNKSPQFDQGEMMKMSNLEKSYFIIKTYDEEKGMECSFIIGLLRSIFIQVRSWEIGQLQENIG